MSVISIKIDCLNISDLDLEPKSSDRLRSMVGMELQRLVEREGLPGSLTDREISTLYVSNESFSAENLAQQILKAIKGSSA